MAGEGLIWAGIGQGIANAGSSMGSFLMQQQAREAEREYRERQAQETRDFRAEQNSLYKRTAEEQMAGRAGKDPGIQPADLQPGGKYAGMAAGQLDMTENQLADLQQYRKSGDLSKYAKPIGTTLDDTYGEQTVTEVPQALKEEFKLKAKALSQLEESYALKGNFDDVMKGRNIGFKTGMGQAAFEKPEVAPRAGQAVAVAEGKPLYDVKDGTQFNQYSGKNEATAVGSSVINENTAKAGLINFKTGVGQGVLAGTTKMGTGSGAVAASEGKPIINVEGGEQYNQYSGESKTTPLGKSQITENQAQAGQAGALAKKYGKDIEKIDAEIKGGMFSKNSSEKLTSWVNSANATITSLDNGPKGSTAEEKAEWKTQRDAAVALRTNAINLQNAGMAAKANPPAPDAVPEKAPSISEVKGAPSGSSIGRRTDEGWEIKDKSGKLIGYTRGKK
jgi:hypothetical protein